VKAGSVLLVLAALLGAAAPLACSSSDSAGTSDAGPGVALDDGGLIDAPGSDGNKLAVDGGFTGPDGAVLRADRFAAKVVSFTPGGCAGYGQSEMPGIVLGPPVGGGAGAGGVDVLSLGVGGEIVLSVEPNAIVDGPGVDFLVFENSFLKVGTSAPFAELGEVSVSDDGVAWQTFPCTSDAGPSYGACAGWRPIYAAPGNGISPVDPMAAGGDPYDLKDIGLTSARFVRIRDLTSPASCPSGPGARPTNAGFDLDAISVVNAKTP